LLDKELLARHNKKVPNYFEEPLILIGLAVSSEPRKPTIAVFTVTDDAYAGGMRSYHIGWLPLEDKSSVVPLAAFREALYDLLSEFVVQRYEQRMGKLPMRMIMLRFGLSDMAEKALQANEVYYGINQVLDKLRSDERLQCVRRDWPKGIPKVEYVLLSKCSRLRTACQASDGSQRLSAPLVPLVIKDKITPQHKWQVFMQLNTSACRNKPQGTLQLTILRDGWKLRMGDYAAFCLYQFVHTLSYGLSYIYCYILTVCLCMCYMCLHRLSYGCALFNGALWPAELLSHC